MLIPAPLHKGDMIGVMAPSSHIDATVLDAGCAALKKLGFHTKIHPQTYLADRQAAGSGRDKAGALHDLVTDPDIKAIIMARGGNRAGTMLEHLDYDLIKAHPKIIMGYSDVTALLNAIYAQTGLVSYHGPVLNSFARAINAQDRRQCLSLLAGRDNESLPLTGTHIIRAGTASGPLIGGNLSVFVSLLGTPYLPDMNGAILFLEDCDDEASRFDRMFLQLRNAGIFNHISGLIIGDFTNMIDSGPNYFGFSLTDIIENATEGTSIPVVSGAPFGHSRRLATYPVGLKAHLNAHENSAPELLPITA